MLGGILGLIPHSFKCILCSFDTQISVPPDNFALSFCSFLYGVCNNTVTSSDITSLRGCGLSEYRIEENVEVVVVYFKVVSRILPGRTEEKTAITISPNV